MRKFVAEDSGEMLDARIKTFEIGLIVEVRISKRSNEFVESGFYIYNIHEIAVLIQAASLQLDFDAVMMGMKLIFSAPVAAEKKMSCYEISLNSNRVK